MHACIQNGSFTQLDHSPPSAWCVVSSPLLLVHVVDYSPLRCQATLVMATTLKMTAKVIQGDSLKSNSMR